eukprot:scaffold76449_cov44-Prasinocladus_malaysianus.AAC.1
MNAFSFQVALRMPRSCTINTGNRRSVELSRGVQFDKVLCFLGVCVGCSRAIEASGTFCRLTKGSPPGRGR